jgi:hypothetical protein
MKIILFLVGILSSASAMALSSQEICTAQTWKNQTLAIEINKDTSATSVGVNQDTIKVYLDDMLITTFHKIETVKVNSETGMIVTDKNQIAALGDLAIDADNGTNYRGDVLVIPYEDPNEMMEKIVSVDLKVKSLKNPKKYTINVDDLDMNCGPVNQ